MFRFYVGVLGLVGLATGGAVAAPMAGPDAEFFPLSVAAAPAEVDGDSLDNVFGDDAMVSDAEMTATRGGIGFNDVQVNNATTNGDVSGVDANNSVTGAISGTALNNVSGTNVVMVNSGNGVVMQSITEINVILNN